MVAAHEVEAFSMERLAPPLKPGAGCFHSVEAVQRRIAAVVGVSVAEQILIVNGSPLDPRQTLGAYKLPVCSGYLASLRSRAWIEHASDYDYCFQRLSMLSITTSMCSSGVTAQWPVQGCSSVLPDASQEEGEQRSSVFLYSKGHLRASGPAPEPETLPHITANGEHAGTPSRHVLLCMLAGCVVACGPALARGNRDAHHCARANPECAV